MDLLKDLGFDPPKKLNIQAVACKKYYFVWNPKVYTAIPYRESTGFLQEIPCVVFPPLHALAVYRV